MTIDTRNPTMSLQGKMALLMSNAAKSLRSFLEQHLPQDRPTWWKDYVFGALSFQQQRMVEQQGITSLAQLDLAALLRVLDQNWNVFTGKSDLSHSDRNFVKEMFSVRNRWAHISTIGIAEDDAYRDLDTLQRFSAAIRADSALIDAIKTAKSEVRQLPPKVSAPMTHESPQESTTEFSVGQIVSLKSNPALTGAVVDIMPGQPENRYSVFHAGAVTTYYASQLQAPQATATTPRWLSLPEFHAGLSAIQICDPSLSSLFSLNAAKIDFVPYQYRPVLKFIRADRPRLLIADGVGVGKTIEAGLILRELQARSNVQKVLIICPKPLVVERKWELEMKRFDERFVHLDGKSLRYCIDEMHLDGEWSEQHNKAIVPYSLFDETLLHGERHNGTRRRGLLDLDPSPRFDLVIVDEAHRIRNAGTYIHEGVRFFCDNADAVLFLTATPLQLGSDDLFVILNVLRPDLIIDRESFSHMAAPNPFINRAVGLVRTQPDGTWMTCAREAMLGAATTPWGKQFLQDNPEFQRVFDLLGNETITAEERVDAISSLERLHTFSGIINRTRRRDIGQFTIRRPETVEIAFTEQQQELHDEILRVQASILTSLHGDRSVKFLMTTIRRQAASCLFGLVPMLKEILTRRLGELGMADPDYADECGDDVPVDSIRSEVSQVLAKANRLTPEDPKLNALIDIVRTKQALTNNKVMVFSTFRHTLAYLLEHTKNAGLRVGMVHGGVPDEERVQLRNRFRLPKDASEAIDILLFSEVGCEGLDYEFCDCMVNYDLPWNPMRVEQRIGRIDRRGQKSELVTIYNMITPGTVDAEIYHRCLLRIGVFNQEIGSNEEILGEITRQIRNIAEDLSLTQQEQADKLQQLADNQIRLIQQEQELEDKQHEFFGLRLPERQTENEIATASSSWLSPLAMQNLLDQYLRTLCGSSQDYILGEKPLKTLRLSQEGRDRLLQDFRKLSRQKGATYRNWENWLKGTEPHLSITFEAACAVENPETVLITPMHPAVRQAATVCNPQHCLMIACLVQDEASPPGEYPFAIYQWRRHGLREDMELHSVCVPPLEDESVMRLLGKIDTEVVIDAPVPTSTVLDELESRHYARWLHARNQHRERVQQLAAYRQESLKTSHAARLAVLREQLVRATDDKIRRMRQSQIATVEADFQRRGKELEEAIAHADITSHMVVQGVLTVRTR